MKIFYSIMSVLLLLETFGLKNTEAKRYCFAGFIVSTIALLLYQFLPYILK